MALLHIGHNIPEQVGGFPGDFLYRPVGAQIGRGKKGAAEQLQLFRLGQVGQGNIVPRRYHPRKVGLDPDRAERGDNQQRRRLEVNLIAEQLLHRRVQVGVAALELPAEPLLQVGVGKAARHPFLEGESLRIAVFPRGGVAHQAAKIQKHLLRRLLFAELNAHPLADERARQQAGRLGLAKEGHTLSPWQNKIPAYYSRGGRGCATGQAAKTIRSSHVNTRQNPVKSPPANPRPAGRRRAVWPPPRRAGTPHNWRRQSRPNPEPIARQ